MQKSIQKESKTKQTIALTISGMASEGLALLTVIILTRLMPQSEYGTYRQFILVVSWLVPIFAAGIPISLLYFVPRMSSLETTGILIRRTLVTLAILGIMASAPLVLLANPVSRAFKNPELENILLVGSLYPVFLLGLTSLPPLMIALGRARMCALFGVVSSVVQCICLILAAEFSRSLHVVILAVVGSACFSVGFGLWLTNSYVSLRGPLAPPVVATREIVSYSMPLMLGAIVSKWGRNIGQTVVASLFDTRTYAIYSVGALEIPVVSLLQQSIYSVLLPEISMLMSRNDRDSVKILWRRTAEKAMAVIMPFFGVALLISYPLMATLYSTAYVGAVPIFRLYLLIIPIRTISFGLLLRAVGKTQYDLYGSILFLIATLGFSVVLTNPLGILGPPCGTVAAWFVAAAYKVIMVKRVLRFSVRDLLVPDRLIIITLITVIPAGLPFALGLGHLLKSIPWACCAVATYVAIVVGIYYATGIWSRLQLHVLFRRPTVT